MTTSPDTLGDALAEFAAGVVAEAETAFSVLRDTGTTTASATVSFVARVPGTDWLVAVKHPDPFQPGTRPVAVVTPLDGPVRPERELGDGPRYVSVFRKHAWLATIAHIHAPYLGAWAQTHRPFPLRYVPAQRATVADELPVYVDRRATEAEFILGALADDPDIPGILEANGGATVWSRGSVLDLARSFLLLEEGARLQVLAEPLGGAQPLGPGVLRQQWWHNSLHATERGCQRIAENER